MNIRLAHPDEHSRTADVMADAYRQYSADLTDEEWALYEHEIRDIDSRAAFSDLIVAVEDDTVVGAVTYYRPGSGGGYGGLWPDGWPSIRLLSVLPSHRNRGIGRALTEDCIRRARDDGAAGIALGTTKLMEIARAMYERMGFVHHPEYDWDPVPGITVFTYLLPFEA